MKNNPILILILSLSITILSGTTFGQTSDFKKSDIKKVIEYIHDHYREDYTSFGNSKILDWQKAVVSMMFVHAYEVLGEAKYLEWAKDALYVEYNLSDDQCWGANALLELNRHGVQIKSGNYKDESGKAFQMNYAYQDIFNYGLTSSHKTAPSPYFGYYDDPKENGKGGIFWNRNFSSYNTCTLGQAIILAFRMPESEINGKSPIEFANAWLHLQRDLLIDRNSGLIYDNYQLKSRQSNIGNYSYNNGIVLGAIGLASKKARSQFPDLEKTASTVVDFVVNQMAEKGVLYSPSADFRNSNAHAFNGIFMHFVPYFIFSECPDAAKNKLNDFITQCAIAVWNQIDAKPGETENKFAVSYSWGKPFNAAETDCMTTVSGAECLLTFLQIQEKKLPFDYR
ncbi:MAG: glycoside hydrolase family 76 protein [Prolixibacteraceae bacterium]|jgi:hypothetical protein